MIQAAPVIRPWLVVLLFVVVATTPARAEPAEEAIRFQYQAPPECPDQPSFEAQVRARTQRGRAAEPLELARTFTLELVADARGFSGNIEFLDDGGSKVSRRVHGEQCDAVVSSMALITALALDSTLRGDDELAPEEDAPTQAQPVATTPVAPRPTAAEPVRPRPRAARLLKSARLGFSGGYASAISAPRVGVLGQVDLQPGMALRLLAHYGWHTFDVDEGRRAKLRQQGMEASICPLRWGTAELGVAPCGQVELGILQAAGVREGKLTSAGDDTILWASVGAELRLAWEPPAPFWLEVRGLGEVPLRSGYRFTFSQPDADAYKVPVIAGAVDLAAGVRFW